MKFIQSCYAKTRCLRHSWGLWCTCSANFYNTLCRHHAFFFGGGLGHQPSRCFYMFTYPWANIYWVFELSGKVKKHLNHPGMHRMEPQTKEIEKGFGAGSCRDGPIPCAKMFKVVVCSLFLHIHNYIHTIFIPWISENPQITKAQTYNPKTVLWVHCIPLNARRRSLQRPMYPIWKPPFETQRLVYHPRWVAFDT